MHRNDVYTSQKLSTEGRLKRIRGRYINLEKIPKKSLF